MHSCLNSLCGQLPCDASESKMALAELSQWNIYGSKGPGDASYGNVYNNIVFIQRCLWCAQRLLQTLYTSSVPPVKQVGGKNESCLQMSKRNQSRTPLRFTAGQRQSRKPLSLQRCKETDSFHRVHMDFSVQTSDFSGYSLCGAWWPSCCPVLSRSPKSQVAWLKESGQTL